MESQPCYSADYQLTNTEAISASQEAIRVVMVSLMELAILLLKFNLGNIFREERYGCFVAPHKYFNGVAIVCIVAHKLSACACMCNGTRDPAKQHYFN